MPAFRESNRVVLISDADPNRRRQLKTEIDSRLIVKECESLDHIAEAARIAKPAFLIVGFGSGESAALMSTVEQLRRSLSPESVLVMTEDSPNVIAAAVMRAVENGDASHAPTFQPLSDACLEVVGESAQIEAVRKLLPTLAMTDCNILITGETGTGKDLVARVIHRLSRRAAGPFVCVNCAALPETLIESELFGHEKGAFTGASTRQSGQFVIASGGTLFLDEIGDMTLCAQAKILRAIETREVMPLAARKPVPIDVRVIAATHQQLEDLVEEKKFRVDLFYRLNVARIHLPPLRERRDDIPLIADHLLTELNVRHGSRVWEITPSALQLLCAHDWPGNVRQLRNVLESAILTCPSGPITERVLRDLHWCFGRGTAITRRLDSPQLDHTMVQHEREHIIRALKTCMWNKSRAAETLHWSRMTLYRKIAKYKIDKLSQSEDMPTGKPSWQPGKAAPL
jgi:DNA-binding NtrC family response regulator